MKNISEVIREKREGLGISTKEFSDALGLGKGGEKLLRLWEEGTAVSSEQECRKIIDFAKERPYAANCNSGKFSFIDLFAGIGGIRIPFQELGGVCVFSSEWDRFAQKTYKANFGETPQVYERILKEIESFLVSDEQYKEV